MIRIDRRIEMNHAVSQNLYSTRSRHTIIETSRRPWNDPIPINLVRDGRVCFRNKKENGRMRILGLATSMGKNQRDNMRISVKM